MKKPLIIGLGASLIILIGVILFFTKPDLIPIGWFGSTIGGNNKNRVTLDDVLNSKAGFSNLSGSDAQQLADKGAISNGNRNITGDGIVVRAKSGGPSDNSSQAVSPDSIFTTDFDAVTINSGDEDQQSIFNTYKLQISLVEKERGIKLPEFAFTLKLHHSSSRQTIEAQLKTDSEGIAQYELPHSGFYSLLILTGEYSVIQSSLRISKGANISKHYLEKSGSLLVKATGVNGKKVENLSATVKGDIRTRRSTLEPYVLVYDSVTDEYEFKNLPIGSIELAFKGDGYRTTAYYKLRIDSEKANKLDVQLEEARIITFSLRGADYSKVGDSIEIELTSAISRQTLVGEGRGAEGREFAGRDQVSRTVSRENLVAHLNDNQLYELEFDNKDIKTVVLNATGYIPRIVNIQTGKDHYDVDLEQGAMGTCRVIDQNDAPIANAKVTIFRTTRRQEVLSDKDGIALFEGLLNEERLRVHVEKKGYASARPNWNYGQSAKELVVKLTEGQGVQGFVQANETPASGVNVYLYRVGNRTNLATTSQTDSEGKFFFHDLQKEQYQVKAFHEDLGVASSGVFKFEDKGIDLALVLVPEVSLSIKLEDQSGQPLAGENIVLANGFEREGGYSFVTDAEGRYVCNNMIHGNYNIMLNNEVLRSDKRFVVVPQQGEFLIKAENKDLIELIVTEGSAPYKGSLTVYLETSFFSSPITLIEPQPGKYFIEVPRRGNRNTNDFFFLVEAADFAVARVGPFRTRESVGNKINVKLLKGKGYKVAVKEKASGNFMPNVLVEILQGKTLVQSLPTDTTGQIFFANLSDQFQIKIEHSGYAKFLHDFSKSDKRELVVELTKGGTIKGYYERPPNEDATNTMAFLEPSGESFKIDSDGKFEFVNVAPGVYTIRIEKTVRGGQRKIEKDQTELRVEEGETVEIIIKSRTSLEINILKDGALSNEFGNLYIFNHSNYLYNTNKELRDDLTGITRDPSPTSFTNRDGTIATSNLRPGEYIIEYLYKGQKVFQKILVLMNQYNHVVCKTPFATLNIDVKYEAGAKVEKPLVTLYPGEKYKLRDSHLGVSQVCQAGKTSFLLMPDTPYYVVVEEDYRYDYQPVVLGPIYVESGKVGSYQVNLPVGRSCQFKVVDKATKAPLKDAAYLIQFMNGDILQRGFKSAWDMHPFTNKNGILPIKGWPSENFYLMVSKEGYEFQSILIDSSHNGHEELTIELEPASKIQLQFSRFLEAPISVGLLDSNGKMLVKPVVMTSRKKGESGSYYQNVTGGKVDFADLKAGDYYVGYFWNGSDQLLMRQGPYKLEVGKTLNVNSTFSMEGY